jgi:hypothetical protein
MQIVNLVLQNSFPDAGPLIHFIYSDQCYLIFLKVDFRGISQPYYGVNIEKNNYPIENTQHYSISINANKHTQESWVWK